MHGVSPTDVPATNLVSFDEKTISRLRATGDALVCRLLEGATPLPFAFADYSDDTDLTRAFDDLFLQITDDDLSLPDDLAVRIATHPKASVATRENLAHRTASPEVLTCLAADKDPYVVLAVARNTATPGAALQATGREAANSYAQCQQSDTYRDAFLAVCVSVTIHESAPPATVRSLITDSGDIGTACRDKVFAPFSRPSDAAFEALALYLRDAAPNPTGTDTQLATLLRVHKRCPAWFSAPHGAATGTAVDL